jgi:ATP-binding cassette, subfamily A (ABC1), member 3
MFYAAASAAAAAGGIIYLASYIPYFCIGSTDRYATLSAGTKVGCSLISNLAMGIGCQIIASFESTGQRLYQLLLSSVK